MNDDEYKAFLTALARKHVKIDPLSPEGVSDLQSLRHELERTSSTCRLNWLAAERPADPRLRQALAEDLRRPGVLNVLSALERVGLIAAIEEDPDTLFHNFRRSAVPEEDVELLRQAGFQDSEAEITIWVAYARQHLAHSDANFSNTVRRAADALSEAANLLESGLFEPEGIRILDPIKLTKEPRSRTTDAAPTTLGTAEGSKDRVKRKLFNGIGKVLGGVITATGNILLGVGSVVAPNPAVAYAVIGSSALAVAGICQGIGDLRGER